MKSGCSVVTGRTEGATTETIPVGSQLGSSNPPKTHATESKQMALDDYPICQRFPWGKERTPREEEKEGPQDRGRYEKEETHKSGIKIWALNTHGIGTEEK